MPADFDTIVNLAKKRGFVFQSSEIYGGLRSAYDYEENLCVQIRLVSPALELRRGTH